jgi:hypothetical protein
MKKIGEFVAEHVNKALAAAAAAAFGYFAAVGYWFCDILAVNEIYCAPLLVRSEIFFGIGVLIAILCMAWRLVSTPVANKAAVILFAIAIICLAALMIITRETALPRTPEEIIEIHYVVPPQVVLGFILGQILIWIFDYVGSDLRDYVRKKFKLDNSDIT